MSTSWRSGSLLFACSWKRRSFVARCFSLRLENISYLALGAMKNPLYSYVFRIHTVLILSLQYDKMAYLYIEHKITGFAKFTDMGGNGEISIKKSVYGWIWIWPNGVEWVSKFCLVKDSSRHIVTSHVRSGQVTWNTVRSATAKLLKLAGGVPSLKFHSPPNSCIPSRAKMRMKRNSRNSSEMMERIELSSEMTRFRRDDQYLQHNSRPRYKSTYHINQAVAGGISPPTTCLWGVNPISGRLLATPISGRGVV